MVYSNYGPVDNLFYTPAVTAVAPTMPTNTINGWYIVAGAAVVVILGVAVTEWIKYQDAKTKE